MEKKRINHWLDAIQELHDDIEEAALIMECPELITPTREQDEAIARQQFQSWAEETLKKYML